MMVGLILNAWQIPDGTTVYRVMGEKPYIIRKDLQLFTNSDSRVNVEIRIDDGFDPVFLIDITSGTIGAIDSSVKLRVDLELEEICEFVKGILGD